MRASVRLKRRPRQERGENVAGPQQGEVEGLKQECDRVREYDGRSEDVAGHKRG
jgi:hypothetical protein